MVRHSCKLPVKHCLTDSLAKQVVARDVLPQILCFLYFFLGGGGRWELFNRRKW